eukprot:scaffold12678_cov57-Phaeocystis_antarctica.AAC.1
MPTQRTQPYTLPPSARCIEKLGTFKRRWSAVSPTKMRLQPVVTNPRRGINRVPSASVPQASARGRTGLVGCARVPGEQRSEGDADRVARASIAPQHTCSVAMLLDPCTYSRPFLTYLPSRSN